eukprot:TRINITY_DN2225_c0_g1_i2.p1 TRINITY_DN2225_c0_g1~~TRINITY_DN2225_c0_g1_i2.p1  ORF type:complete len:1320 (+),score=264.91 TRINITY_DN2225_c0_g1_i2:73-3960(+)
MVATTTTTTTSTRAPGVCKFKSGDALMQALRESWGCDANAALPDTCPCLGGNGQSTFACPTGLKWTPAQGEQCVNAVVDRQKDWVTGPAFMSASYGASCSSPNHETSSLQCTRTHADQAEFGVPAGGCSEYGDGYNEDMNSSSWCVGQKFCFVDPCNCNQADIAISNYFPAASNGGKAAYYSFATCGGVNLWKTDQCANFNDGSSCATDGACMWDPVAVVPTPPPTPAPLCVFKTGDDLMRVLRSTWGCDANAPLPTSCPCLGHNKQTNFTCPSSGLKWTPATGEKCVSAVVDRKKGWVPGDAVMSASYGASCSSPNLETGSLICTRTHPDQAEFGVPGGSCQQLYGDGYNEAMDSDSWCVGQKFCFVDPCNCNEADIAVSNYFPASKNNGVSAYYSYATCGGVNAWKTDSCAALSSEGTCTADPACMWPTTTTTSTTRGPGVCKFKQGSDLMIALRASWGCDASAALPTSCPCLGSNGQATFACPSNLKWTPAAGEMCVKATVDRKAGWVPGEATMSASYGATCESPNHETSSLECTKTHADQKEFGIPGGSCPEYGDGYNEAMNSSAWCVGQKFCFVDPCNCNEVDIAASNYFPAAANNGKSAYYSFETCGGTNLWKTDQCANFMDMSSCASDGACMWDADAEEVVPTPSPAPAPQCVFKTGEDLMKALRSTWGCDANAPMPTSCPCLGYNKQSNFTCPTSGLKWTPAPGEKCVNAVVDIKKGWVTGDAVMSASYGASCSSPNHETSSLICTATHQDQAEFGVPGGSCSELYGDGYNEAMDSASWCVGQKFCFVDPCNCNAADIAVSNYFPAEANNGVPAYYSFATCGGVNLWKTDHCAALADEQKCNADAACTYGAGTGAVVKLRVTGSAKITVDNGTAFCLDEDMINAFKATFKNVDSVAVTCKVEGGGRRLRDVQRNARRLAETVILDYTLEKTVPESSKEAHIQTLLQTLQAQTPQTVQAAMLAELEKIAPDKAKTATFTVAEVVNPTVAEVVNPTDATDVSLVSIASVENKDDGTAAIVVIIVVSIAVILFSVGVYMHCTRKPPAPAQESSQAQQQQAQQAQQPNIAEQEETPAPVASPPLSTPAVQQPEPAPIAPEQTNEDLAAAVIVSFTEEEFPTGMETLYQKGDQVEVFSDSQWLLGKIEAFARNNEGLPLYSVTTSTNNIIKPVEPSCLRMPLDGLVSIWEDGAWKLASVTSSIEAGKISYQVADNGPVKTPECVKARYTANDLVEVFLPKQGGWQDAMVKSCTHAEADQAARWAEATVQIPGTWKLETVQTWQLRPGTCVEL